METQEQSKPIVTEPAAEKQFATTSYFFPNDGVTIEATSREEAEKKLAALKNTK